MSCPLHSLLLWKSQCQTGEPKPPVGTAWNVPEPLEKSQVVVLVTSHGSVAMVKSTWIPSAQWAGVIPGFPVCSNQDPSKTGLLTMSSTFSSCFSIGKPFQPLLLDRWDLAVIACLERTGMARAAVSWKKGIRGSSLFPSKQTPAPANISLGTA